MAWGQGRSSSLRARARRALPAQCNGCGAREVPFDLDHIHNLANGGDPDSLANVQWLCKPCHKDKTQREQAAGRAKAQATRGGMSRRRRDTERHPGTKG